CRQGLTDQLGSTGLEEISRDNNWPTRADRFDFCCQCMQSIFAPCNQRQFVAVPREHSRQRHADSGGGAGNYSDGARICHIFIIPAGPLITSKKRAVAPNRYSRNLLGGKSRENTGCSTNFFGSKVQN